MSKQAFDKKIEAIDALRSAPTSPTTVDQLRKALKDRSNYVVAKAAAVVADLAFSDLIPDLIAAFERLLVDPVKSDAQCWGKNAIAKALKGLGHRDPGVFLRGLVHVQMEPVWGGQSDSAPTLRGACALALINCQLDDLSLLAQLTHGLADPAKPVRIDTAVAIAQLGRTEGALLLRLKTLLGDTEPEVLGQCFSSLLSLSPRESVQFIGEFLKAPSEDIQQEAAGALAQSGQTEAIEHLTRFWEERLSPEMRRALLIHFASSPMPELSEFVLSVVENERSELSAHALAALATSRHRTNLAGRISAVVNERRDPNLRRIFEREFGSQG